MSAPKVRVHEVSKVLGVPNAEVIAVLEKEFGVAVKSHSSSIDQSVADKVIARFKNGKAAPPAKKAAIKSEPAKPEPPKKAEPAKPQPRPEPVVAKPVATPVAQAQPEKPKQSSPPAAVEGKKPVAPQQPPVKPVGKAVPPSAPPVAAKPSVSQPSVRPPAQPAASRPAPPVQPGARPTAPGGFPSPAGQRPVMAASTQVQKTPVPQQPAAPSRAPQAPPPQMRAPEAPADRSRPMSARQRMEEEKAAQDALPKIACIDDAIVVRDLAEKLNMRETEIIKHLFMKGMMVTVNQTLEVDFARNLATELGFEVETTETVKHEGEYSHLNSEGKKKLDEALFRNLQERPPVVSIMGHVDHGKTTLLDSIRESRHKVVDSEAGGITQSIGAYTVERNDRKIVFLDTPGHEAFTSMRMRGAQATDIAILVVAADDGVMPQTIEAINHAKVAKIPILIAVNKVDKPDADPDKVLVQLAEYGLSAEKWGGDTLTCEVSALQKMGLDDLLDNILLVSELLDLKADPTVEGNGVIIEAQLDKRMGPVATALVQNGTLKVGENVLIGSVGGRVRALISDTGARIQSAGPATPVEILGLDGVPNAGETFRVIHNDKVFKQELAAEKQREREQRIGVTRSVAAGFTGRTETEPTKESQFHLLVKADTQGSLEAVIDVLQRMISNEIKINIVHSATGDISEADVMLAATANALLIGFNSKADPNAHRLSEKQGVLIKYYDVIYHITEDIEKWVLGQLAPETEEVKVGAAEIRQIFKVGKSGIIAGCMVTDGKLVRNAKAIVLRDGKEVFSGPLNNLKRFKDDVKEVASGYECGISFERFNDLQEGDIVEVYTVKSLERTSL